MPRPTKNFVFLVDHHRPWHLHMSKNRGCWRVGARDAKQAMKLLHNEMGQPDEEHDE